MSQQYRSCPNPCRTYGQPVCGQLLQSITRLAVLIVLVVSCVTACTSADDREAAATDVQIDLVIAELFETTARSGGATYRVGRRALVELGPDIRDYLLAKADSADWQDKWLARALIVEIDHPERAELIRRVLGAIDRCEVRLLDDGELAIDYDQKDLDDQAQSAGKTLVVGRETIALFVQALPRYGDELYARTPHPPTASLLEAMVHFDDPATVEPVLWRCKHRAVDALVAMGDPVVKVLNEAVALPDGWREKPDATARVAAAMVLGKIGNKSSASTLLAEMRTLATADTPQRDQLGLIVAEAYCIALADLQVSGAAPVMFDLLVRIADGWSRSGYHGPSRAYSEIRAAMLSLGPAARAELTARLDSEQAATHRAIAGEMLIAMDNPIDPSAEAPEVANVHLWGLPVLPAGRTGNWPRPSVLEQVASGARLEGLPLATLADHPLALEVLEQILLSHGETPRDECRYYHTPIIFALRDMGDVRAVGTLRRHIQRRPTQCVHWVIDAIVKLADVEGVAILDEIIAAGESTGTSRWKLEDGFIKKARDARAVLTASLDDLQEMATSRSSHLRREATYVLARRGHVEAAAVLLDKIIPDPNWMEPEWYDELIRLGEIVLPTLRERFDSTSHADEKLLCEALILRLTDPKLATEFDELMRPPIIPELAIGPLDDRAISTEVYMKAGQHIADRIDPDALPLLEVQAMLTGEAVPAYALAAIGEDRSLAMMLRHIGNKISPSAILAFGPVGRKALVEAAQSPQPGHLAIPHWPITIAFATAKEPDPAGLEMILEVLELAKAGQVGGIAQNYFQMGRRYHDPRLADAAFYIAQAYPENWYAPQVLHEYDDPRLDEVCTRYLKLTTSGGQEVVRLLIEEKADDFGSYFTEQLAGCDDKAHLHRMIGSLAYAHGNLSAEARRDLAHGLLRYLSDPDAQTQGFAAGKLALFAPGQSEEVTEGLVEWAKAQDHPLPEQLMAYLGKSQHPEAGAILLASYRQYANAGRLLLLALEELRYEPAVAEVAEVMTRHIAEWQSEKVRYRLDRVIQEMRALCQLGPSGRAKVVSIVREDPNLAIRVEAAQASAKGSAVDPDPEQLKLTEELLARLSTNGVDDPSLAGTVDERTKAYRNMVQTLMAALQACPTDKAYPALLAASLQVEDPVIREGLSKRVIEIARRDPDLPALPPAYP